MIDSPKVAFVNAGEKIGYHIADVTRYVVTVCKNKQAAIRGVIAARICASVLTLASIYCLMSGLVSTRPSTVTARRYCPAGMVERS